jgi:hypothetical protein
LQETAGIQASRNRKDSEELNVLIDEAQKTLVPLWNDHFNGLHLVLLLRRGHARMSCLGRNHSCVIAPDASFNRVSLLFSGRTSINFVTA